MTTLAAVTVLAALLVNDPVMPNKDMIFKSNGQMIVAVRPDGSVICVPLSRAQIAALSPRMRTIYTKLCGGVS